MRGKGVAVLAGFVAVCVLLYGGYRVARHLGAFNKSAAPLPVFTSQCGGVPTASRILPHPIVTFGDSITEGYGATRKCLPRELRAILPESAHVLYSADTSYPADLDRVFHHEVLNYGVGGETTKDGLIRFRRVLGLVHPSSIVILEGINDLLGGLSERTVAGRLDAMVRSAKQAHSRPVLVTLLPPDGSRWNYVQSHVAALNNAIRAIGRAEHINVADAKQSFSRYRPLSKMYRHSDGREDGLHPNDVGYGVLAGVVARAIR